MSTPSQFVAKLATLEARMNANVASSVGEAALVIKKGVQSRLVDAIGADRRMSGVGKRGARVNVRYDVKGTVNPTALLRMTGPAHLIERNTSPHTITARARTTTMSGRRRRGASALSLGNGRFAASVKHPGTKGKQPFERGVNAAAPSAQKILANAVTKSLAEVFK